MPLSNLLMQFVIAFSVALLLDLYVVGPVAKKIALSLPYDKSKKVFVMLAISTCMMSGMVLCMSFYGLITAYYLRSVNVDLFPASYMKLATQNFVLAYPQQLILIGPLVRYLFLKFFQEHPAVKAF